MSRRIICDLGHAGHQKGHGRHHGGGYGRLWSRQDFGTFQFCDRYPAPPLGVSTL